MLSDTVKDCQENQIRSPDSLDAMGSKISMRNPDSSTFRVIESPHPRTLNWRDITAGFFRWCDELKPGELLAPESFTLYDAMSAIELMDPKMDIGTMLKNRSVKSFDHGAQTGKLKLEGFLTSEYIAVIDRSLSLMLLWTQGHCLAQTVFTLVYLHKPNDVKDELMSTFCMTMLELLDHIRQIMVDGGVVEEEDFQMSTSYLPSMNDPNLVKGATLLRNLKSAEESANKNMRRCKSLAKENGQETSDLDASRWNAISLRLRFCRTLLHFFGSFRNRADNFFIEAPQQIDFLHGILEKLTINSFDSDIEAIPGFEPLINVHLLPPSFPRHTPLVTKGGPYQVFKELVSEFSTVLGVKDHLKNMEALLTFLRSTSGIFSQALTRSMIQIVLDGIFGLKSSEQALGSWLMVSFTDFIADSIRQYSNAPMLIPNLGPLEEEKSVHDYVASFLKTCRAIFAILIRNYGFNRARQRDALANSLADFYSLQDDAEKLDDVFSHLLTEMKLYGFNHAFCFGSWTLTNMLGVMEDYLISGLDLQLYADQELHFIYWYLHDVLYHCEMQTIIRADSAARENEAALNAFQENEARQTKKNGKKKPSNRSKPSVDNGTFRPHRSYLARAQSLHQICGAYHLLLLGLEWQGKLKSSPESLDCEELRYYHRLMPFMERNAPAFVDYEQYRMVKTVIARNKLLSDGVDVNCVRDAYSKASASFAQAEQFLPIWAKDQIRQDLTKVCRRNDVIIKILATGRSCKNVELAFDTHPWFPTLRLL